MFRKRKHTALHIIIATMLFLAILSVIAIGHLLPGYLSVTKKVHANVLVLEGWIPPYAVEMAADIFKNGGYDVIITTGLKSSDYYMMYMNGYLIFYTRHFFKDLNTSKNHLIEIEAYGELSHENAAHFNLLLNDSLAGNFLTTRHTKRFALKYNGRLSDLDSVMIQFDNDKHGDFGDRNLFVKDIIVDRMLKIPYQNNSVYDIGAPDGKYRIVNNFDSYADLARKRLLLSNINSSTVISLPGKKVKINRTITSVLAFRNWLDTTNIKITGINIITIGFHARRTLMTYKHILNNNNIKIGVISLPDYKSQHSQITGYYRLFHECIGILYYWFILHFY